MKTPSRFARLVGRPWFWACLVAALFAWPIVRTLGLKPPEPPPVLGSVPAFTLTDHHGRAFGSEDLKGRVWAAAFFCTRCPTAPDVTAKMSRIQHRSRGMGEAFRLVSFTTDPEHDTVDRLSAYADGHRVSKQRWLFLTGPHEAVARVVEGGFHVKLGGPEVESAGGQLVLVDGEMRVRGFYDASDPASVDALLQAAGAVAGAARP